MNDAISTKRMLDSSLADTVCYKIQNRPGIWHNLFVCDDYKNRIIRADNVPLRLIGFRFQGVRCLITVDGFNKVKAKLRFNRAMYNMYR